MTFRLLDSISTLLLANKDAWYVIASSHDNPELGFQKLDCFFKSLSSFFVNQLWIILKASLDDFMNFFGQFKQATSPLSLFHLDLQINGNQVRFSPAEQDFDSVICSCLDEMVSCIQELPRIETKLFTSLAQERLVMPMLYVDEEMARQKKTFRSILKKNLVNPQKQLHLYEKFRNLYSKKTDRRIGDFILANNELTLVEAVRGSFLSDAYS